MSESPPPTDLSAEPEDEAAKDLKQNLEGLVEEWLRPYLQRIASGSTRLESKVLNDALWGSIRLHPWEVAVLDSPLIQRLRRLRQLGVIHWVFPNAGHSRLEHSIGVVHLIDLLADCIERNSGSAGEQIIDDETRMLMRLAGLVHDCGHTVMSHVSEPFIKGLPAVEALRDWLYDLYRPRKTPSPSEAFAAVFVRSPAFRELMTRPEIGADFFRDADEACSHIAGLLLGAPTFPEKAFLSLVINGAFDADKLDYMPRDSLMAGVPCAVDVARLVEKVHCVTVPWGKHEKMLGPFRSWAQIKAGDPLEVLALPRAAASALDELAVTRTILYDKVYYHQKARALEAMVRSLLEKMERRSIVDWLRLDDRQLLELDDELAQALKDRRLPKRAYYIPPPIEPDEPADSDPAGEGWRRLSKDLKSGKFQAAVDKEARKACAALDIDSDGFDSLPPLPDFPDVKKIELDQFAFIGDDYRNLELADAALSGQRSEIGKRVARAGGYVFAREDLLRPSFFGALKVLSSDYHQAPRTAVYAKTKLEPEELAADYVSLDEAGFFGTTAPALSLDTSIASHRSRRMERFLRTAWPRLQRLATDFGRFQSPGQPPVSARSIASFLRQFERVPRARATLKVLEQVKLKDRDFFATAIRNTLEALKGKIDFCCPLGGSGDSSSILNYFMNDVPEALRVKVLPLELALEKDLPNGILLWDDFCGAGGHAITALAQWLEAESNIRGDEGLAKVILDEDLADPLSEERKAALLGTNVYVNFALARDVGLENLAKALPFMGLVDERATIHPAAETVSAEDELFADGLGPFFGREDQGDLKAFMETKAREILQEKVDSGRWSAKKLGERLLGYGNTAKLLVFFYNVPTVTLTPLWQRSSASDWKPLFPRRGKPPAGGIEPA